jgi:TP901 family phage tail tape measure protein
MSAQYDIQVNVDLGRANQQVASITQAIAAIGAANSGGAPGVTALQNQLQQIIATNPSVANVIRSLGQTGQSANAAARGLNSAGTAAAGTSSAFGSLGQSVAAANNRLASLNGTMGNLALAGASGGVLAVAGAMAFGVKSASEYADKMAEISTLVDTTKFSMDALSAGLKEQAELYGQSPIAQAGAAYDIISSGASTAADAISTLNAANLLAAVGATKVETAANGLTSVVNAFASQALTATQAADSMFITVRDGKITMEQLSASIGNVAPIAATLGLSLDDVGASIAALTLGGVQGSEAVTNIRAALTSIIKPSSEASKLAKQIGLDYSSSALKAKGWAAFLEDIKVKTKGSQDQMAVLAGGVEGLSAMLALTGTGADSFNASLDHMARKIGVAADALKKIQDASPTFQMSRVMAAIKVEAIGLGEGITQSLLPAIKFLADNFSTISTVIASLLIPLAARMVVIYGTTLVQAIATFAATSAMRFASVAAAQGVLAASTATLSGAIGGLASLFGGPLGIALAGAGYGLYTLATNSSSARDVVEQLGDRASAAAVHTNETGVQSLFAARGVTTFGGKAGEAAGKLWEMANAARAAAVETARLNLTKANGNLDTAVGQTSTGLRARYNMEREKPKNTFGDAVRGVGSYAQIAYDYVMKPGENVGRVAVAQAMNERQRAAKALADAQKPAEAYIQRPTPLGPGGGVPKPDKKDGKGGADKVDPEIKKAEECAKKEREYFQQLTATADLAAMLPQQAELYNKQLDLRKVRGDGELKDAIQLSEADKTRISDALKLADVNGLIRNIKVAQAAADMDALHIKDKITATAGVSAEKAAENLAVEEQLWSFKEDALKKGISLSDVELQKQLAILDAKARQNYQTERANVLAKEAISNGADYGKGAIAEYGTKDAKIKLATATRDKTLANLNAARTDGKLDIDGFNAGVKKAGVEFRAAVDGAADAWVNKLSGVLYQLGDMIGGKVGALVNGAGNVSSSIGDFAKNSGDVSKGVTGLFKDPNSNLAKGIGKATGNAMAGLKIGESVQQLSKMIGLKLNATGSKIGGALGGLTGNPLIAAAGSFVGGLIGNLFSKPKEASAGLSVVNGVATAGTATGYGSAAKKSAAALSGSVANGLNNIASQLGGSIGSLSGVSVGYRPNHKAGAYRVDTTGQGKLTGVAAFEDESEAIAFAIKTAISQGAITGLTPTVQKALSSLGADAAIAFSQSWTNAMADYDSMLNPIAASIKEINNPIDALKATLVSLGDTASDQAKLEQYRQAKLDQLMKAQTKTFSDLMESLNGEATGVTALSRFTTDMQEFAAFQNDIKVGKQVNQDDFAALINKLIAENAVINGTSTAAAQANTQAYRDAVTAAEQLVKNEFNTGTKSNAAANDNATVDPTAAINNGTTVVAAGIAATNASMAINNSYQAQILEAVQSLKSGGGNITAINTRVAQV